MTLCNACDFDGKSSREHLWHVDVLRAGLGDPDLRRKDRAGVLQGYERYEHDRQTPAKRDVSVNMEIRNLLCEQCNNVWANRLEGDAGRSLTGFLVEGTALDHRLIRRWAAFMAIKVWWALAPNGPNDLPRGTLRPILTRIRKPDANVLMPVRIGRVHPWPSVEAACHIPSLADGGFTRWRIGALAFFFTIPGNSPRSRVALPTIFRELDRDYRLDDLPEIPKAAYARLLGLV